MKDRLTIIPVTEKLVKDGIEQITASHNGLSLDLEALRSFCIGQKYAWAILDLNSKVRVLGGFVPLQCGCYEAWALVDNNLSFGEIRSLQKIVKRKIDDLKADRLQCAVLVEFKKGTNWVKRLGFKYEGLMGNFFGKGKHAIRASVLN